jgi:hypothetical protein
LVSQEILEHEISLKERMLDIAKNISNTTLALHCYMDQVGVAVPDMSEIVASIIFSEVSLTLFSRYTSRDSRDRTLTYELRLAGYTLFEDVTSEEDEVTYES